MDGPGDRRDGRSRGEDRHHRHRREDRHHNHADGHRERRGSRSHSPERKRRRSGSPREDRRSSHPHHRRRRDDAKPAAAAAATTTVDLPFSARALQKSELATFKPLLAEFLFIQKCKDISSMDEREVRGRWKSFVGKWNRGELAEGWYDPETFERVRKRAVEEEWFGPEESHGGMDVGGSEEAARSGGEDEGEAAVEDDDEFGPVLPGKGQGKLSGPGMPSRQDLALRDEQRLEDRSVSVTALRSARRADRAVQKERLDELTPRAEAGTRERRLEKRALLNEKLKGFRERSPGGEVPDSEMMGGAAGDELEEYRREKERAQRRKSERELRREEMERVRREEMEQKRRRWKEKEEGTVEGLRELVRQRFG